MRSEFRNRNYSAYTGRKYRRKKALIRAGVTAGAVILIIVALVLFSRPESDTNDTDTTNAVLPTQSPVSSVATTAFSGDSAASTPAVTQATLSATEPEPAENSPAFAEIISRAGYTEADIEGSQLITVDAWGVNATLNTFEKIDGVWTKTKILTDTSGFVGLQGVSESASEYTSYTPKGLFALSTAFGICDDPGTGLDYFKVTEDSYWVDDPKSQFYNCHVEGTENKDWDSAEHLIEYSGSYDYCVFIEYNTNPVIPEKGSAFFLHVGESSTAGCVAISRSDMIEVLKWLSKAQSPHILIF